MCTKFAPALIGAFAGAALLAGASIAAQAMPAAALQGGHDGDGVTLVADDCGLGFHRGPGGFCRRNEDRIVVAPGAVVVEPRAVVVVPERVCPLGTHLGPHRRECLPN
jgi:hypothetical protein